MVPKNLRKHTFKPGQSGNPAGRPPKERAWAALIAKYGNKVVTLSDGKKKPAQDIIAELTIRALTTGIVDFPRIRGERRARNAMTLEARDWVKFLKETREHLEGGPTLDIDLTSAGEPVGVGVTVYIPDNKRGDDGDS